MTGSLWAEQQKNKTTRINYIPSGKFEHAVRQSTRNFTKMKNVNSIFSQLRVEINLCWIEWYQKWQSECKFHREEVASQTKVPSGKFEDLVRHAQFTTYFIWEKNENSILFTSIQDLNLEVKNIICFMLSFWGTFFSWCWVYMRPSPACVEFMSNVPKILYTTVLTISVSYGSDFPCISIKDMIQTTSFPSHFCLLS